MQCEGRIGDVLLYFYLFLKYRGAVKISMVNVACLISIYLFFKKRFYLFTLFKKNILFIYF